MKRTPKPHFLKRDGVFYSPSHDYHELATGAKTEVKVLRAGSRLAEVSRLRTSLSIQLVNDLGLSLAESARQLGVTTSAIAKILQRHS
jgi:hypothetical protein